MLNHFCTCCGRHCYLDEPQCEREIIYRENGELPTQKPKAGANGEIRKPLEKKLKYLSWSKEFA